MPGSATHARRSSRHLRPAFIRHRVVVAAELTQPWSSRQTKGQITRLKLVKRKMFGRGKLDLLEARMTGVTQM